MTTSKDVRAQLIDALRLDITKPRSGEASDDRCVEDVLRVAPSKWYLTGFLVPYAPPTAERAA